MSRTEVLIPFLPVASFRTCLPCVSEGRKSQGQRKEPGPGVFSVGFLQTEPNPPGLWGGVEGRGGRPPPHSAEDPAALYPPPPRGKASVLADLHSVWNLKGSFHLF